MKIQQCVKGQDSQDTKGDEMGEDRQMETAHPTAMDTRSVYVMLKELRQEMSTMKDEIRKEISEAVEQKQMQIPEDLKQQCKEEALQNFADDLECDRQTVSEIKQQLKHSQLKNKVMASVIDNLEMQVADLTARVENVEISNSRNYVTISGLVAPDKKNELIDDIDTFFQETIGANVYIEDAYKLGSKEPKLIVVALKSAQDKKILMEKKSALKNFIGPNEERFYINSYSTLAAQEKRKRERSIIEENEKQAGEEKLEIVRAKGGLRIQGQIYQKKVRPPTPSEMINMSLEDYDAMMMVKTTRGKKVDMDDSSFIAYTKAVNSHYEKRELYRKMRLINPGARHIICAYLINGSEPHYDRDFCDDQEPSAGRILLDWMKKRNLQCRVIFVACFCGQMKLSSDRFRGYIEAAEDAVAKDSYNYILNLQQSCLYQEQENNDSQEETGNSEGGDGKKKVYSSKFLTGHVSMSKSRGRGQYYRQNTRRRGHIYGRSKGGSVWHSQQTQQKFFSEPMEAP